MRSVSPMSDEFDLINKDSLRVLSVGKDRTSKLSTTISLSFPNQPLATNGTHCGRHNVTSVSASPSSPLPPHSTLSYSYTPRVSSSIISSNVKTRVQHALNLRSQMITPVLNDQKHIDSSIDNGASNHPTIVSALALSGANAFRIAEEGASVSHQSDALRVPASKRLANLLALLHSDSADGCKSDLIADTLQPFFSKGADNGSTGTEERKDLIDQVLSEASKSSTIEGTVKKRSLPPRRPLSPAPRLHSAPLTTKSTVFESAIQAEYPYPLDYNNITPSSSIKSSSTLKKLESPSSLSSASSDKLIGFLGSGINLVSGNSVDILIQSIGSTHEIVRDKVPTVTVDTSSPKVKVRRPPPPPPSPSSSSSFAQYSNKIDNNGVEGYLTGCNSSSQVKFDPLTQEEINKIENAAATAAEDEERKKVIDELSTRNAAERSVTKDSLKKLHKLNAMAVTNLRVPFI